MEISSVFDFKKQDTKLKILYLLNISDIILTQFVLINYPNLFQEINPVMKPIVTTQLALIIKIIVPLVLCFIWSKRIRRANEKVLKVSNTGLNILLVFYSIVNILHIINLIIIVYLH